jgi:hypothetical protein
MEDAAYHEAGHAVIARVLGLSTSGATIKATEEELGHAIVGNPLSGWRRGDGPRRNLVEAFILSLFAGGESEKFFIGNSDSVGDGPDLAKIGAAMEKIRIPGAVYVGDEYWQAYTEKLRRKAANLVRQHSKTIKKVAMALLEKESLTFEQLNELVNPERES